MCADTGGSEQHAPSPRSPFTCSSGYDEVRKFRDDLIDRHRGCALEDLFSGRAVTCPSGTCYVIESREAVALKGPEPDRAAAAILGDLTLIRGIGRATERRLREQGYRTIADLAGHPRYSREADRLLDLVAAGDVHDLVNRIGHRRPVSDPLFLEVSRFHAPEDFVFLDIETLGLSSRPIILIGIARICGGSIVVRQHLLRSADDEAAVLATILPGLEREGTALVTFNGRAFDIPYIRDRLACHDIPGGPEMPHYDLLLAARRRWSGSLPSCSLDVLEERLLGIHRADDVPGRLVPEFYEVYRRTGNPGPLIPIVEHNRQDVVSLARLLALLRGDGGGDTGVAGQNTL